MFLPLHFWALGTALEGAERLDAFLVWSEHPLVKTGEWGIVVALAAHLGCGLRVLALEFLPWRDWQRTLTAWAATLVLGFALVSGLNMLRFFG